jgi:metallo-beta-lactamase family protein
MTKLLFHGACGEVTGSMHMIEQDGHYIPVDCGLFQGNRSDANPKNHIFPIPPAKIDVVVLSHSHIDHCGRLPLLVKEGFQGTVYTTPASFDLAAILLADAAHIQMEDAEFYNRKRLKKGELPIEPLYDNEDAAQAMKSFISIPYNHSFDIGFGIKVKFFDAGHILGSSIVLLEIPSGDAKKPPIRLCYSGDLGRPNVPILMDPSPLPECDYLITESTYGARIHDDAINMKEKLRQQILLAVERSGKIIIPAFSVERTQTLVYYLQQLVHEGQLPHIPIFIDSPLSVNATEIFRAHPECFDTEARNLLARSGDILGNGCCRFIHQTEESKTLNTFNKPCVIISASGMCEAGRILHHLANNITDPKNTVLIVGFQAMHTLGRRIVEREPEVTIFGRKYPLKCHVKTLNGFSSHADAHELRAWLQPRAKTIREVFLVHGEPDQQEGLIKILNELNLPKYRRPQMGDTFEIE